MGLFSFFTTKRKVNIPQIGKLFILKSPDGNVLGGKSFDERIGNSYEIYFNVVEEELISGQLESYISLLEQWVDLVEKIKLELAKNQTITSFHVERILIAEPYDESFDVDLNFIGAEREFSVTLKDSAIIDIRYIEEE